MSKIFVISGPSGAGKDTILEAMMKIFPELSRCISYTDREKRLDDKSDSYHFISKNEFDEFIKNGEIIEWENARDERRYGTGKSEIYKLLEKNKNIIKIVGPKMFPNFKKLFGDKVIGIFIKFENLEILKKRIKEKRPDITLEDLEVRYNQAFQDMEFEKEYKYSVVNPEGHPEKAIEEIEEIIRKELNE